MRPPAGLLAAALVAVAGCSPRVTEGSDETERRAAADTVRLVVERRDTVHTADTVRLFVRERGDTVTVWRDHVRWRERVTERRDTVLRIRRDTLWRTRTETVTVERPRRVADWLWPMAVGAVAGAACIALLRRG